LFQSGIEGRIAIVTDVGWNAVDANGSQGEAIVRADGEVVWSWRPRYLALSSSEADRLREGRRWQTGWFTEESAYKS
jgi:hypothetical protein